MVNRHYDAFMAPVHCAFVFLIESFCLRQLLVNYSESTRWMSVDFIAIYQHHFTKLLGSGNKYI